MSLIKCNKCGEMYSDSYRTCPFCEEDEFFYKGGLKKGRKRSEGGRKSPSIVGPVLILVVLLVLALVVWHFFGDRIFPSRKSQEETPSTPVEETVTPEVEATPAVVLEMDKTVQLVLGESKVLTVSGGTEYDWISSDPAVATVSAEGEVTAISEGTAIVTVTDVGGGSAVCSVTVVAEAIGGEDGNTGSSGESGSSGSSGATGSTGGEAKVDLSNLVLKSEYGTTIKPTSPGEFDISMKSGDSFNLKLEGTTASVHWSTANSGVATMSDSGNIKAVGRGSTTITGTLGSSAVHILVRVT